jgi:hypothetical protein
MHGPCLLVGFNSLYAACQALMHGGLEVAHDAAVLSTADGDTAFTNALADHRTGRYPHLLVDARSTYALANNAARRRPCRTWPARSCAWPKALAVLMSQSVHAGVQPFVLADAMCCLPMQLQPCISLAVFSPMACAAVGLQHDSPLWLDYNDTSAWTPCKQAMHLRLAQPRAQS